jgi:hypothetical protein
LTFFEGFATGGACQQVSTTASTDQSQGSRLQLDEEGLVFGARNRFSDHGLPQVHVAFSLLDAWPRCLMEPSRIHIPTTSFIPLRRLLFYASRDGMRLAKGERSQYQFEGNSYCRYERRLRYQLFLMRGSGASVRFAARLSINMSRLDCLATSGALNVANSLDRLAGSDVK